MTCAGVSSTRRSPMDAFSSLDGEPGGDLAEELLSSSCRERGRRLFARSPRRACHRRRNASIGERRVDETPAHVTPLLDVALADDDHIRRDPRPRSARASRTDSTAAFSTSSSTTQVAAWPSVAPRMRDRTARQARCLRQSAARLDDGRLIDHAGHASRSVRRNRIRESALDDGGAPSRELAAALPARFVRSSASRTSLGAAGQRASHRQPFLLNRLAAVPSRLGGGADWASSSNPRRASGSRARATLPAPPVVGWTTFPGTLPAVVPLEPHLPDRDRRRLALRGLASYPAVSSSRF